MQPDLLAEGAHSLHDHRLHHGCTRLQPLPRAPRDRPRSAPRPALIADLYFAAALASCAGARLGARHGASSRGIRPESKPASCGCEYLSSQAGATWGTIKAISVQFAAAFAARSSQIELSRCAQTPIRGSWQWGWRAVRPIRRLTFTSLVLSKLFPGLNCRASAGCADTQALEINPDVLRHRR